MLMIVHLIVSFPRALLGEQFPTIPTGLLTDLYWRASPTRVAQWESMTGLDLSPSLETCGQCYLG